MQTSTGPGIVAVILVVVVAGAFVGLATAHDARGDRAHDDCETADGADDCSMMGGMMQMDDECQMNGAERGMGGTHADSAEGHTHADCPMH